MNETNVVDVNKEVVTWLKDHPLVSRRGICKAISVDPGNFHRWVTRGPIPSTVLDRLVPVLRLYGYGQENGIPLPADYVEVKSVTLENGEPVIPKVKKKDGKKVQAKKEAPESEEKASTARTWPMSRYYDIGIRDADTREELEALSTEIKENPNVGPTDRKDFKVRIDFKLNRLK